MEHVQCITGIDQLRFLLNKDLSLRVHLVMHWLCGSTWRYGAHILLVGKMKLVDLTIST